MPYNSLVSRTDTQALISEQVSNAMLTNMAGQSAVLGLATRIPVATNQTRFPVLSALPTAYWVSGDTGLKQTSEAAWDNKYLDIQELAVIVPIPEAVLEDAGFDVFGAIQPQLEEAIARKIDAAVLFDVDAPTIFPDGIVASAVAAGNVVARGTNAAAAGGLHGDLSEVVAKLEADGYIPNGAVGNITLRGRLRQVRATDGQELGLPGDVPSPMYPTALAGLWPTGTNAAEYIAGDFSKLIVGVRRDFTYKLITEGVITDGDGAIQYNLPQQDMVALRLTFRMGWQVINPINRYQETESARYPFSVLRSPAS